MFKFFIDECVNTDLVLGLRESGFDALTVRDAGLIGVDDGAIFKFACENKRILLTFDRGFGDIFRFNIAKSCGIVIVLVGQMRQDEIISIVLSFLSTVGKPTDLRGRLIIIGKTKIRIIKR